MNDLCELPMLPAWWRVAVADALPSDRPWPLPLDDLAGFAVSLDADGWPRAARRN